MQVPRALVAALALGTLLAAFLLGRQCSQSGTGVPPVPAATTPAPLGPSATAAAPALERAPDLPAASPTLLAEPPLASLAAAPLPPPASPAAVAGRAGQEIARYFADADAIQARAKYWSDPQTLAKTILEQAASGNAGGFDDLIRAQAKARDELARMPVPAECAEHHRRSLAVMGEGLDLLERVKGALSSGDLGGLDGLQEKARDLEREARAIDELARTIRQP